jgi:hypothetical protein
MMIQIKPDAGGWQRLPDALGFLHEYSAVNNKSGRQNAMLYIQQHSGFTWAFRIFHTKAAYIIEIETTIFKPEE